MRLLALLIVSVSSLVAFADDATQTAEPATLPIAESQYSVEAAKADAIIAKAQAEAAKIYAAGAEKRLKTYRDHLVDVTKTGDFDKALAVKARIQQLESDPDSNAGKKRLRPKDTVKFAGHSYALIKESVTWHVAKRRCEEMGGHLAYVRAPGAFEFIYKMSAGTIAHLGCSDEDEEGKWKWLDGKPYSPNPWENSNSGGVQHYLAILGQTRTLDDIAGGERHFYICEWDR